jgi:hypothetical protein
MSCYCLDVSSTNQQCLWCNKLYELGELEKPVNQTTTSSEYDTYHQNDPKINHSFERPIEIKQEIQFEKIRGGKTIKEHFPNDTSAILSSSSYDEKESMDIINNSMTDYATVTTKANDIVKEIIHKGILIKKSKDDIFQAVSNAIGVEIELQQIENNNALKNIDIIKIPFYLMQRKIYNN